jgi:hypothetical protein
LAGKSDEKDSLEQMKVRIRIIKRMDEEKKKSMITTESIFSVCWRANKWMPWERRQLFFLNLKYWLLFFFNCRIFHGRC